MKRKKLEQAEAEKIIKEENKLEADIDIEELVNRATARDFLNNVDADKKLTNL